MRIERLVDRGERALNCAPFRAASFTMPGGGWYTTAALESVVPIDEAMTKPPSGRVPAMPASV